MLQLPRELELLKVGTIRVDRTKVDANSSKHGNVRYERAGDLIEQLEADIATFLDRAEQADCSEHEAGQQLPEGFARREALKAGLEAARGRMEAEAKARAAREQADYGLPWIYVERAGKSRH